MKRGFTGLFLLVMVLVGCSNHVPLQTELESLASWTNLGGKISVLGNERITSLAFNAAGNPIVVTNSRSFNAYQVKVKQWGNERWRALGGVLNVRPAKDAQNPDLAVDKLGRPVVAWWEESSRLQGYSNIYVKRWDGNGTWTQLGGAVSAGVRGESPSLAVSGDTLMVSWYWWVSGSFPTSSNVYVRRWNGLDKWLSVGRQPVVLEAFDSHLGISPAGVPMLAYYHNPLDPSNQAARGAYVTQYQ